MSAAWFCPACQKHHAPHVETCPGGVGSLPLLPGSFDHTATTKPACKVCGIIFDGPMGYVCPNMQCPSGFAAMSLMTTAGAAQ